jgi:hypothetical protein
VVMNRAGLGPDNDCACEGQQQLETTDPSSRERGCYIRAMTESVQLRENITDRETLGTFRQDELMGCKPLVVK